MLLARRSGAVVVLVVLLKEWSSVDEPLEEKRSGSLSKPSSRDRVDVSADFVCL